MVKEGLGAAELEMGKAAANGDREQEKQCRAE